MSPLPLSQTNWKEYTLVNGFTKERLVTLHSTQRKPGDRFDSSFVSLSGRMSRGVKELGEGEGKQLR